MGIVERVLRARPQASTPAAGGVQAAPFQFYVDGDDAFRLRTWSSQACTVALEGRWLTADGTIQVFRYTFKTDATAQAQEFAMPVQGTYLLNCVLDVLTPITYPGQCFAQLLLGRGDGAAFVKLGTVLQGYIGTGTFLAFPGSPLEDSLSGPGFLQTVAAPATIGGVNFDLFVPASRRWRVHKLSGVYITDGAAPLRSVALEFTFGAGALLGRLPPAGTQGASLAFVYTWAPGLQNGTVANPGGVAQPLPSPLVLDGLFHMTSNTGNMSGADIWNQVRTTVEEWLVVDSTPPFTL